MGVSTGKPSSDSVKKKRSITPLSSAELEETLQDYQIWHSVESGRPMNETRHNFRDRFLFVIKQRGVPFTRKSMERMLQLEDQKRTSMIQATMQESLDILSRKINGSNMLNFFGTPGQKEQFRQLAKALRDA